MHQMTLDQIAEIVRVAGERSERQGPLDAELRPNGGGEPHGHWWAVTTMPNHEGIAGAYLIARRFGIYLPQFPQTQIRRGRKIDYTRNMLPGYIFVYVWDIARHWRRILAIPGVTGMLPRIVPDHMIDTLRAEENKLNPEYVMEEVIYYRKRRKKQQQHVVQRRTQVNPDDIVSVHAKSYWTGIETMNEQQRESLLHKALGLN